MKMIFSNSAFIILTVALSVPLATTATSAVAGESLPTSGFSIKFVSGGTTQEGRAHMQKMASDYDLLVEFQSTGKYATYKNVGLTVTDTTGKVILNAHAGGPLFYVQIPPGDYKVSADMQGKQLVKSVHVARNKTSRLTFDWRT